MRIWQTEHTFEHNWETVVQAAVRKYPNPHNSSIVSQDVVRRELTPNGQLRSHRIYGTDYTGLVQRLKAIGFGSLIKKLVHEDAEIWYGSEHTVVDPVKRRYELRARNITLSSDLTIEERLEYTPHPADPAGRTLLKQSATIRCPSRLFGGLVETVLEQFVYSKTAAKGPVAVEWVIANRGIEALPPPPPPPQPPQLPQSLAASSASPLTSIDLSSIYHALEARAEQVKHLARLVVDEHFLIM